MSYKRRSERDSQPVGRQDRYASDHDDDVIIIGTGGSSSPEDDLPAISVTTPQSCKTSKSHIQSTQPVNRRDLVFHTYQATHELGTPPMQMLPSSRGKKEIVTASEMILTKYTHNKGNSSSPSSRRLHPERERIRERRGYIQNVHQGPLSSGGRMSAASAPRPTHSSSPILNSSTVGSNKLPPKISGRPSQHVSRPVPVSRKDSRDVMMESFRGDPMSTNSSTNISEKARKASQQLASRPKATLGMEHVKHRESVKPGQSVDSRDKGSGTKRQRVLSPDVRGNGVQERKNAGQRVRKHSLGSLDFQRNKAPSVSHLKKPAVSSAAQVGKKAVSNGQEATISKVANGDDVMDTSVSLINTQSPSNRSREKGGVRTNLSDPSQISKQQGHSVAKQKSSHSFTASSSSRDSTDPKQKSASGRTQKRDVDKRVAPAKWPLSTGTISTSVDSVTTTSASSQSGVVGTAKATTNSKRRPPSLSKMDSDTETSSMIGFNDDDLFEVLDSVETDSICSAYNQSDSESLGTSSESYCSKLISEQDRLQPSNLTKSVTCKSPSESRLHDFTMSFVKKRPRVARKSTTWNGAKFYKHPIKGGLLRLKRHCTLKLRRVKCTQYLSKPGQNLEPPHVRQGNQNKLACSAVEASATTESDAGDITPPLKAKAQVSNDMKKKRESKELPPSCVKRLKLSSETEPNKPTLTNSSTVKPSMQKKVTSSENHIRVSSADSGRTVTPEKNHTSSGSATPASKKCLSLKRLQLSRTPSLSDAPTENQPLSPPFLSSSSSLGRASTQEKQGNNTVHLDPKTNPAQQQSKNSNPKTNPAQQQSKNSNPTTSHPHDVGTVIHKEGVQGTSMASGDEHSSVFTGTPSVTHVVCGTSEKATSTASSEQVKPVACGRGERLLSTSSDENNSLAKLSQRDEAYDLRLMETIAKLAPESGGSADNATTTNSRSSVSSVHGEEEVEVLSERDEGGVPMLTVKVPLAQLSRTPSVSPSVTTRAIGMFTEKAVQADQGMIVDKDVLDAYLVVKLHEAMFDMKEQLRMMEVQVAAIAKQKENLERMLQSKTQYIRDMVTTGFKRGTEDKETNTESSLVHSLSSPKRSQATATVATQTKRLRTPSTPSSKDRKGVKMVAKCTQTDTPDYITVSSQTEGMVRVTPARLETPSQPLCLYRHPDSEMQIYIEQAKHTTADFHMESESVEENPLISNPNQQWLSGSVVNGCSRSVAVNPKVRFLRALRDSTAFVERFGCARCIPSSTIVTNATTPQPTLEKAALPKVQFSTNPDTPSDSPPVSSEAACQGDSVAEEKGYDCIPPSLRSSISKLVDIYCKLKALPKQPVQARHMMSLLKALHHLLSHLPVEIEPLPKSYSPKSSVSPSVASTVTAARDAPPSTPTNTTSSTPTTPLSSERPSSSPPSTPGAATWSMGAKLQELMEALHELEEKGRELLPKYFKGELARLQLMVQDTLTFFTSGIQHETFTHDQSGCIVNSDLQPRPWRDQDLQRNPYFRRLCLDVGVRGIIQQVRKLSQQNRQGKRKYSTDDSDVDSDFDIPSPPPQRGTKSTGGGKIKVTREKMKDMKDKARKKVFHVTLPLPSSSRGEETSTSEGLSSTSATSISSPPTNTAASISPLTSPTFSSPSRVSPYSKRITKGETLQVRVAELQSKVKCSVSSQPEATVNTSTVPSNSASTTVSLTSQSIPSIPSNLDALGGNLNAQYMLSQYIHQHLGRKLSTTPQSSVQAVSLQQGMVNTSTVVSKPVSTTCTVSLTSQSIPSAPSASQTVQSLLTLAATKTAPRPSSAAVAGSTQLYKGIQRLQRDPSTASQPSASATDVEGASLRKVVDVLLQVFHTVQVAPPERLALQRMIEHAYQLVASAEYDVVKQLIANISHHLHRALSKTMPQFQSGAAVVARPLPTLTNLPLLTPITFPTNIYPTLPSSILPCVSTHITPLLPSHRVLSHPNTRSGPVLCTSQSAAQGRLPPTATVSVSQSATNLQPPQPHTVREVVQSTASLTTSTVDTAATSATNMGTSTLTGTIASKPIEKTPPSSTTPTTSSLTSIAPTRTLSQVSESQGPTKGRREKTPPTSSPAFAAVCSSSSGGRQSNSPVLTSEGAVVPLRIARIENTVVSSSSSSSSSADGGSSSSSADGGSKNLPTTMSLLSQREPSVSNATTATAATTLVSSPDSLRVTASTCTSTSSTTTPPSTSMSTARPPLSAPNSGVPTSTTVPVSNVSSLTVLTSTSLPSSASIVTTANAPSSSVSSVTTAPSTSVPSSTVTTAVTTAPYSTSSSAPSSTAVTTTALCSTSTCSSASSSTAAQHSTSSSVPTCSSTVQHSTSASIPSSTAVTVAESTAVTAAQHSKSTSASSSTAVTTTAQHSTSSSVPSSTAVTTAQCSTVTSASSSTAITTAHHSTSASVPSSTAQRSTSASSTTVTSITTARRPNRVYSRPVEVPSVVSQGYSGHMTRPVTHTSPPSSLTNPTLRHLSQAIQHSPQPVVRSQATHKSPPPAVKVQASKVFNGLLIKWTLSPEYLVWQNLVVQYDLYAFVCNNKDTKIPDVSLWCKVGEIKPLALPMAVTLTNFAVGQRYAFSVRAKYLSGATSDYSEPCTIDL